MQTSGGRWTLKGGVTVLQIGLGILLQYNATAVSASVFLIRPQTILRLVLTIVSAQYLLHLQSDPISEGGVYDKMVYVGTL